MRSVNSATKTVWHLTTRTKNTCIFNNRSFKTYNEVYSNAEALGSNILALNLAPKQNKHSHYNIGFVAIQSKNREEYQTIELACGLYGK